MYSILHCACTFLQSYTLIFLGYPINYFQVMLYLLMYCSNPTQGSSFFCLSHYHAHTCKLNFNILYFVQVPFEVASTNQMRKILIEARSVRVAPVSYQRESSKEGRLCKICMDSAINTIILPCGHQVDTRSLWFDCLL